MRPGWLKAGAKCALRALPGKPTLVQFGVRLPPALKGRIAMRIFGLLREGCISSLPERLSTNFGMSGGLQIDLPATADPVYLFGTPTQAKGERSSMHLCRRLLERSRSFVDVGAHIGYFTFFLRDVDHAKSIYCFEPHPMLFAELQANCQRNALHAVTALPLAVGSRPGETTFYLNRTDISSSSLTRQFADCHDVEAVSTMVVRFDDFAREEGLHEILAKVDIEGAEFEFLEGVGAEANRIAYLIIEVLGPAVNRGFVNAARERLAMEAYYINDFRLEHSTGGEYVYRAPNYNWLFCRLGPAALSRRLAGSRFSVVAAD